MLTIDEMRTNRFMLLSIIDFFEAITRLVFASSTLTENKGEQQTDTEHGHLLKSAILSADHDHAAAPSASAKLAAAAALKGVQDADEEDKKTKEEETWAKGLERGLCRSQVPTCPSTPLTAQPTCVLIGLSLMFAEIPTTKSLWWL